MAGFGISYGFTGNCAIDAAAISGIGSTCCRWLTVYKYSGLKILVPSSNVEELHICNQWWCMFTVNAVTWDNIYNFYFLTVDNVVVEGGNVVLSYNAWLLGSVLNLGCD